VNSTIATALYMLIGGVVGHYAGRMVKHSRLGANIGAGAGAVAGYLYAGATVPYLIPPDTSTGTSS
jgi:uncharacterized protein YcfJ